ncbi:MAG: NAD(P)/FAD-dependent oxidoreductase [Candidatus Poribacteria bacterium]|nr:NAD(P)/FAD-dependent oxidoreductase [Candidatus Poribacteria bacterium]
MATYDGIILGAGHNGLILQAYLGKAGLRTLSLDRNPEPGGGLATVEYPTGSGFLHNTHSFFHRGVTGLPWYTGLDLARHGANYVEPPRNVALLLRDGNALEWHVEFDRTVDSFAQFSRHDADSLKRWRDDFRPIVRDILIPEAQSAPSPPDERRRRLEQTPEGRLLLKTSKMSPLEFVRREFTHPVIQAGLLFFNGLREVDLRAKGFGHHIPFLLASDGKAQMCLGGSANLGRALVSAVEESGGKVKCGVSLKRILVEGGKAVGVETTDGEVFRATRFVASSLNPQQTFLDLIEPNALPDEWRTHAEAFQYNLLAPLFGLHLCLSEPPDYGSPAGNESLMVILGLEEAGQFDEIVRHHENGTIPPTVMWGACPTRFDPSQAPLGHHSAFMWEKLPYRLNGDPLNWERAALQHGQDVLQMWGEYAPNLNDAVIDSFTRTPLDTARRLPNMRGGDLLVGAFTNGQVGYNRPFPGAGHYRTPINGLYLCGSCCHPGGNVTGLPGFNAAKVLLADLGG